MRLSTGEGRDERALKAERTSAVEIVVLARSRSKTAVFNRAKTKAVVAKGHVICRNCNPRNMNMTSISATTRHMPTRSWTKIRYEGMMRRDKSDGHG